MIIDQLPTLASVQETDEIPVERGTTTYKTTLQKLKTLFLSFITYPVTSVNNMTGDVEISPLIAYPVGSIYMSVNSTSPATLFGGTWEQLEDTFLLAAGTNYAAGSTGGEATHTLTVDEMPNHSHLGYVGTTDAGSSDAARLGYANYAYRQLMTAVGGGQPHNNMPPYLAVYMWKRTA